MLIPLTLIAWSTGELDMVTDFFYGEIIIYLGYLYFYKNGCILYFNCFFFIKIAGNGVRPMERSLVFSPIPFVLCDGFHIDVFHSSVNTSQFSFNHYNCRSFEGRTINKNLVIPWPNNVSRIYLQPCLGRIQANFTWFLAYLLCRIY